MEVYIVANIRTVNNNLKGYRLINIDGKNGVEVKDVTKQQLLYVLKNKTLKVENAKKSGEKVIGIYSALDELTNLICSNDLSEISFRGTQFKWVVLKTLYANSATVMAIIANYKGEIKRISYGDLVKLAANNMVSNAYIDKVQGFIVKAKKQESEQLKTKIVQSQNNADIITDEEAVNGDIEWDINRFMKYMEQHNYSYHLEDCNKRLIKETSSTFVESRYETVLGHPYFVLSEIDPACKILHIPVNVYDIRDLWEINDTTPSGRIYMDTIIVSKTVAHTVNILSNHDETLQKIAGSNLMKDLINVRWMTVRKLIFQQEKDVTKIKDAEKNLIGFCNIEVENMYNLPITRITKLYDTYTAIIKNTFNSMTLPFKPDFTQCKNIGATITISSSFNATEFKDNGTLDLTGVYYVEQSFNEMSGCNSIKFGNDIEKVYRSFNSEYYSCANTKGLVSVKGIELKSKTLKNIYDSFNLDKEYIDVLDLTGLEKLDYIGCTFKNADMGQIILPDCTSKILDFAVNYKGDKPIVMPSAIKTGQFDFNSLGLSNKDVLDWSRTSLDTLASYLILYREGDELTISDNFIRLKNRALSGTNFKTVKSGKNIVEVGQYAFANSGIEKFYSSVFPKLTYIPLQCFGGSELRELAIEQNVTTIEDEAFFDCRRLQKVLISDSVTSIGKNAFKISEQINNSINCYVVNNSYAHRALKRLKNLVVIPFDSYEEAYREFIGEPGLTEGQKARMFIISTSKPEYSNLTKEPYLSNYKKIIRMCEESQIEVTPDQSILNTQPLDFEGVDISELLSAYDLNRINTVRREVKDKNTSTFKLRFMYYCNLLTSIAPDQGRLFSSKYKDTWKAFITNLNTICYIDSKTLIASICVKTFNNIVCAGVIIVIDNKIVWSALFDNNGTSFIVSETSCVLAHASYMEDEENLNTKETKIGTYIKTGDSYTVYGEDTLGGCVLPDEDLYNNLWRSMIDNNLIIIGFDYATCMEKLARKRYSSNSKITNLTWYDLTTGNVITTAQRVNIHFDNKYSTYIHNYGNHLKLDKMHNITVTSVMSLADAIKTVKSKLLNISDILEAFSCSYVKQLYKVTCTTKEELDNLYKAEGAYDKAELNKDGKLLAVSEVIRTNKLYKPEMLNKEITQYILESGLCFKLSNRLSTAYERLGQPNIITLRDGSMLMEFSLKHPRDNARVGDEYKVYAVAGMLDDSTNVKLYMSYFKMESLLYKIGSLSIDLNDEERHEISNKEINTDDFTFFTCKVYEEKMCKLEIAIQHKTLEVFVVSNDDDMSYYTLFRFRNFADADKFLFEYTPVKTEAVDHYVNTFGDTLVYSDETIEKSLAYIHYAVKSKNVLRAKNSTTCTDIAILREAIMQGLPNNYPILYKRADIFEKLAKQPAKWACKCVK